MSEAAIDRIFDQFGLFLRCFASITVGVSVAWMADSGTTKKELGLILEVGWPFAILIAVVGGSILYAIHRAIALPLLCHFFLRKFTLWLASKKNLQVAIVGDLKRWAGRAEPGNEEKAMFAELEKWADNTHFLFCSAWAALVVPWAVLSPGQYGLSLQSSAPVLAFVVLIIAAVVSDVRQNIREYSLTDKELRKNIATKISLLGESPEGSPPTTTPPSLPVENEVEE